MGSSGKRTRGPNKHTPWSRSAADGVSVLRLALDISDRVQREATEAMFSTAYSLRRAVQRDARARCRAFWAAHHERASSPAAARERLGLSRTALEHAAYAHLDAAPHLRRFATKALALHLADSVWTATERHLFRDARGNRHGLLRIGRYYDFTRLPGRARSHTTEHKWETFRLHGTLEGHRATYTDRDGDFVQPRHLRGVQSDAWWSYAGPLAVVFSGLHGGTLVLPVRLPTAPSNQPVLDHHLADPSRWHKIDLVRRRDPHAVGGWRYEAHLMVLTTPYVSPAVAIRRANTAISTMDRTAGVDVNVSNITVASHDSGRAIRVTRIERDPVQKANDDKRSRRERRRQRELDRSRRAANRAQYQLSKRQEKRARRRAAAGLSAVQVVPMGLRNARADGVPLESYKRDALSKTYQRTRAAVVADAVAAAQARRQRARQIATELVATHGYQLVAEDVRVSAWSRSWGRGVAAFSPGTLLAAIDREAHAVAAIARGEGGVIRAATYTTAMSQHCPCGARVDKRLADRIHHCDRCQLRGDRDAVSAVLASFVQFEQRNEPASARVDYDRARSALGEIRRALSRSSPLSGWQDTLSESTDLCARDGSFVAWRTSTSVTALRSGRVARRNVGIASCPTLNETSFGWTKSDRPRACAPTCPATTFTGRIYGTPLSS